MEDRDSVRTYDHGADERMIKDPTCGDVGDADSTVAIAHITKHCQKSLEEGPGAPCFQDHIEILNESTRNVIFSIRESENPVVDRAVSTCLSLRRRQVTGVEIWFRLAEPLVCQESPALQQVL